MLILFLILAAAAYTVQTIILFIGIARADRVAVCDACEPTVSIIVAARNEEATIGSCLRSLANLDYPPSKLQILIVNDGSTDATAKLVAEFSGQRPGIELLTAPPGRGNLRGKSNAVATGIAHATGEILMFTDADCTVPLTWVRETVSYFQESTGVVGGFTLLESRSAFGGMQALDWIYLFGLASSSAGWKLPLTVIGNNLSIRREAYDATGGYEEIPFSVTEDYALVQAIITRSDYKVAFPVRPGMAVQSLPCRGLEQLFRQKQRWGVGGLDMVFRGMVIMFIGWVGRVTLFLGLAAGAPGYALLMTLAVVLGCDFAFLSKVLGKFHRRDLLRYFPVFALYYYIYVPVIPFVAMASRNVVWKERSL